VGGAGGCRGRAGRLRFRAAAALRLDPDPAREMRTWPSAPEVPRYRHEGTLLGEMNYVAPGGPAKPAWRAALEWVAGLGESRDAIDELLRPSGGARKDAGASW